MLRRRGPRRRPRSAAAGSLRDDVRFAHARWVTRRRTPPEERSSLGKLLRALLMSPWP